MNISAGFNEVATNPYFIVIASLASIFGTILALTVFFPPQKKPFYAVKSFNLVSDSISVLENLEVKLNCWGERGQQKKDLQCLTISKIMFWNGGRKIITSNDVANKYPIQVESKGDVEILGIGLYEESISNKATNISLTNRSLLVSDGERQEIVVINGSRIIFDFLESGDAAVIMVLHTGVSSEDIYLDGYIMDSQFDGKFKLKDISLYERNYTQIIVFFKVYGIFLLATILLIVVTNKISPNYFEFRDFDNNEHMSIITSILVSSFISSFPTTLFKSNFFSTIKLRIPKISLEIFDSRISK